MNTLYIVHSFKGKNKFKPLAMGHIQDVVHVNYFLQIGRERLYVILIGVFTYAMLIVEMFINCSKIGN